MLKGPKMRRSESTESSASTDRPSPPWTSVFSDAKLDLVFSKSSSAWWLDGKRKVSLRRDACYNKPQRKKNKLRKLWKFTKTVAKSQQTGRFGTPFICWNTRFLIHVLCVQSIHLPKGWETATCRHRSVDTAEGAAMVAFGRARLWRGWLSQLRKRHVPSGEARYSRPVEVDASLGCPGWGTRLIYLSTLKCRLIYSS